MKAFIYCRVSPHNRAVAKPDRLEAQEERCKRFLLDNRIDWLKTHKDEGEVHPVHFTSALRTLLQDTRQSDHKIYIVADHPARLSKTNNIQTKLISLIKAAGGQFIWPKPGLRIESLTSSIINEIEGLDYGKY